MTEVDDSDAPHASEMLRRYRFRRTRLYRWLRPPEPVLLNTRERRLPAAVKPLLFVGGAGATLPSDYISLDMTPYPGVTVVGNIEELPFATDSIGSASCDAVLEHVRRPQRAVDELFRVLKPGAYLHVC